MYKRTTIFTILTISMILMLALTGCGSDNTETDTQDTDTQGSEVSLIDTYVMTTPEFSEPVYTDSWSGIAYSYPEGYDVTDVDGEYQIIANGEDGCLLVFSDAYCDRVDDGVNTFEAFRQHFDRMEVILNGKQTEITTVDGDSGSVTQRDIGGRDTKVYTGEVYVNSKTYPGTFYCTAFDGKPIAVVKVGATEADPEYILNNIGSLTYSGSPITDHPQNQLAMTTLTYGDITMEVPAAWDVYKGINNSVVLRPPVCNMNTLSNCQIVFYESDQTYDEWFDPTLDFYETALTNACGQNPSIDNHLKFLYVVNGREELVVNNKAVTMVYIEVLPQIRSLQARSSLPGRNLSLYHFSMAREDGKAICVAFFADPDKNKTQLKNLADALIQTVN